MSSLCQREDWYYCCMARRQKAKHLCHLVTTTDEPANQLPPTEDAFEQHVLRAQYQVQIWNQSHIPEPEMATWAMGGAYQNRESFIQCITRRSRLPAKVRDITHLYFVLLGQNVHWSKCSCVVAGLSCIDICSCALCW